MPKMVFSYTDRDKAHQKLVKMLASGKHPAAECREDPNSDKPYQVWDKPYVKPEPTEEEILESQLAAIEIRDPAILNALADQIAVRLKEREE